MPNLAYTTYKIQGSEDEVAALYKTIKDLAERDESLLPNGFGKLWLGNLVEELGGRWQELSCRGHIIDFSLTGGLLTIHTESAWREMSDVRHLIESTYLCLEIYFQTEEPGMCIFQTNDASGEYFPSRWLLDWNDEANNLYIWEYFRDLPAVIEYLKNNGIITAAIEPTKAAITAVLDQIQEERPDEISFMFEEVEVVED